jgi:hypothetical protein
VFLAPGPQAVSVQRCKDEVQQSAWPIDESSVPVKHVMQDGAFISQPLHPSNEVALVSHSSSVHAGPFVYRLFLGAQEVGALATGASDGGLRHRIIRP